MSDYPTAFTTGGSMYHSAKSDLLTRFKHIDGAIITSKCSSTSAVVVDLSVIVNALSNRKSIKPKTFQDFLVL